MNMSVVGDTTQFSAVAEHYGDMNSLPEAAVLNLTIADHFSTLDVRNARVLDIACGTGRWSRYTCAAGARHVVGVDVSSAMIETARTRLASGDDDDRHKIDFVVADCSQSLVGAVFEEPFDIVLAFCFLNYAADEAEMLRMWRVMADKLLPGGKVVALVPNLNLDDDFTIAIDPRYGTSFMKVEDVNVGADDWGFKTRFTAFLPKQAVEFDMYRLNRNVYTRTAEKAGMIDIQFSRMQYPSEPQHSTYWDEYQRRPHYELLTATRGEGLHR